MAKMQRWIDLLAALLRRNYPASLDELVASGRIASTSQRDRIVEIARALFALGSAHARRQGLLLVDTKYELGLDEDGELVVIDEIHTPDSSRYWRTEGYEQALSAGRSPSAIRRSARQLQAARRSTCSVARVAR